LLARSSAAGGALARLRFGGSVRGGRRALAREALLERLHQVDDLRLRRGRLDDGGLLTRHLLVDDLAEPVAVVVAVLLGLEALDGELSDELLRELHLAVAPLAGIAERDVVEGSDLVGVVER